MKKDKSLAKLFKGNIGISYIAFIIVLVIILSALMSGGITPNNGSTLTGSPVTPMVPATTSGHPVLQLYTFGFTTPAPTISTISITPPPGTTSTSVANGKVCTVDGGDEILLIPACGADSQCDYISQEYLAYACDASFCSGKYDNGVFLDTLLNGPAGVVYCIVQTGAPDPNEIATPANIAAAAALVPGSCQEACEGKPVIYLYPTKPTLVSVSLTVPGVIVASIPQYPQNGWENVLAQPDGTLTYQGKTYSELFYESQVDRVSPSQSGVVITASDLREKLTEITFKLGLKPSEQAEFLGYWLPRLNQLNSPYILFSLTDPAEKERIDHVDITPAPQTRIEFLVDFKPLKEPIQVNPLILPVNPPKRVGFTEVEWGGTIDYK